MARGLQINQVGDAFKTVPGFSYKEASQMGSDVTVNSSSWFAIQPVTGTHTVEIPVGGKFRAELAVHPLPATSIATYKFRIIFNEGESNEVIAGDDLSWAFRSNNLGQYHFIEFVDYVDLPAGPNTYKVQATRIDGSGQITLYNNAISRPPVVTIQGISGSGTGGVILTKGTNTSGNLDPSLYNELTLGNWLTIASETINTIEGEDVFINALMRCRKTNSGVTQPRSALFIDGTEIIGQDEQIADQWDFADISISHVAESMTAGEHTISLGVSSYQSSNVVYQYFLRDFSIVQFRGGYSPWQQDGSGVILAPSAMNVVSPLAVTASGTVAELRMPDLALTTLSDAPAGYTGKADYFVKVKQTEDGIEFVAPSGGGASPTTFTELTDTPSSYSGEVHKLVRVNSAGDGLEFVAPSGTSGSETFTGLTDTPSAYSGLANYIVRVKEDETGLEIVAPSGIQGATLLEQTTGSGETAITASTSEDVISDTITVSGPEDVVIVSYTGYWKTTDTNVNVYATTSLKVDGEVFAPSNFLYMKPTSANGSTRQNGSFVRQITGLSAGSHTFAVNVYAGVANITATPVTFDLSISRGGIQAFTNGSDTPDTYTGAGHHILRVKQTEDGVEFVAPSGTPGVTTFTGLSDTPSSFSGQSHKLLRVNQAGDAVEFVVPSGAVAAGLDGQITSVGTTLISQQYQSGNTALWDHVSGLDQTVTVSEGERIWISLVGSAFSNVGAGTSTHYIVVLMDGTAISDRVLYINAKAYSLYEMNDVSASIITEPLSAGEHTFQVRCAKYDGTEQNWNLTNAKLATAVYRGGYVPVTMSGLADTPNSYDGYGHYFVKVKADESGVEFVAPSGVQNLLDLADTPSTYSGFEHYLARVNLAGDALEFVAPSGMNAGISVDLTDGQGFNTAVTANEPSYDDLASETITVADGEQVKIDVHCWGRANSTTNTMMWIRTYNVSTATELSQVRENSQSTSEYRNLSHSFVTDPLTAGSHTIKLQATTNTTDWTVNGYRLCVTRYRGGYQNPIVTFSGLNDTPNNYDNAGHYLVRVKQDETGVEFVAPSGTPGVTTFSELSDTPSSYAGLANRLVQVNSAEDGLEFVVASGLGVGSPGETAYPFMQYASASTVTINAQPGAGDVVRVGLQDHKVRSFTSPLTCDISTDLDTGSEAVSTWYYVYLVPDAGNDLLLVPVISASSPATGPTGYTNWAYIGPVYNSSASDFIEFTQFNDLFVRPITTNWATLYSGSGTTPGGSWGSVDIVSNLLAPATWGSLVLTGWLDHDDTSNSHLVVTTDFGTPSYTPGGFNNSQQFLSGQDNMHCVNTREFYNMGNDLVWYRWVLSGSPTLDWSIRVMAFRDRYLTQRLMAGRATPPLTSFIEFTDTPTTYSGYAGQLMRVNDTEDGIEFVQASGIQTITDTSVMNNDPSVDIPYGSWDTLFEENINSPVPEDITLYISGAIRGTTTAWTSTYFRILLDDVKVWPPASTGLDQTLFQAMAGHNGYTLAPGTYAVVLEDLSVGSHNIKVEFQNFTGTGHNQYRNMYFQLVQHHTLGVGSKDFVGLEDVPSTFVGQAHKQVRVNVTEDALEFIAPSGTHTTVLSLDDTPSTFSGSGHYLARVNLSENALEFVAPSGINFDEAFTDLTDSPASYSGAGDYFVKVKPTADGVEFVAPSGVVSSFTDLDDTPSSLSGSGHYLLRVDQTGTTIETVAPSGVNNNFTDLDDVPSAYTGYGASLVRVNAAETGLEFAPTTVASGVQVTSATLAANFTTTSDHTVYQDVDNGSGDALSVTFDAVAGETVKFLARAIWREAGVGTGAIMRGQFVLDSTGLAESRSAFWIDSNNSADYFQLEHYETISTTGSHTVKVQLKSNSDAVQLDSSASEPAMLRVVQYRNVKPGTALGTTKTASFNLLAGTINRIDISSGNVTGTLPDAASVAGQIIKVLITAGNPSYEATITDGGSFTEYLHAPGYCSEFYSDGTGYYWLKRGQAYVDRGDLASWDLTNGSMTRDGNYYDWDISSIIPNAAKDKMIKFYIYNTHSAYVEAAIRENGNSNQVNTLWGWYTGSGTAAKDRDEIKCDANGVVEYKVTSAVGTQQFVIVGWWVDV